VAFFAFLTELPAFAVAEKILHSFSAFPHGDYPTGLVADTAGNFYGTAQGGSYNQGIVYRLVADSQGKVTQTVLYNFTGGLDGGNPVGVVPDNAGNPTVSPTWEVRKTLECFSSSVHRLTAFGQRVLFTTSPIRVMGPLMALQSTLAAENSMVKLMVGAQTTGSSSS
jgi:uncharacterized repeat protein (TIGR03803 family)